MAMHHCQSIAEHMHAGELSGFQYLCAPGGFEKCQPQQHDDERCEAKRMRDKLVGQLVGRVGDDRLDAYRRAALQQEINGRSRIGAAMVQQVCGDHPVTGSAQDPDDSPGAACWLPDDPGQALCAQQRMNRLRWRFV